MRIKQEIDIEALSSRLYPFSNAERNAFIAGHNKTKEIYKYTKEDMDKAMRLFAKWDTVDEYSMSEVFEIIDKSKLNGDDKQ